MFHKRFLNQFNDLEKEVKEYLDLYGSCSYEEQFLGEKNLKVYDLKREPPLPKDLTFRTMCDACKNSLAYHIGNSVVMAERDDFIKNTNKAWPVIIILRAYFLMKEYFNKDFVEKIFNEKMPIIKNDKLRDFKEFCNSIDIDRAPKDLSKYLNDSFLYYKKIRKILFDELNKTY